MLTGVCSPWNRLSEAEQGRARALGEEMVASLGRLDEVQRTFCGSRVLDRWGRPYPRKAALGGTPVTVPLAWAPIDAGKPC